MCVPDYHVDDVFHAESNTFEGDERSAVTTALLNQLRIDHADERAAPVQCRATVPEVITEHARDAYEPSVSQRGNCSRYAYFNCKNGEFLQTEVFNISGKQIVDMTGLNFYTHVDRAW